jgi:hypothetical protein
MRLTWRGPFQIKNYLENAISRDPVWWRRWPPVDNAVYLVSRRSWTESPTTACLPLYVGGTTGESERFRTRVGDLIADLFGFYGGNTGHHSGAQSLYDWCYEKRVHPRDLWLGWARGRGRRSCSRCAEVHLYNTFPRATKTVPGLLNRRRPPGCTQH